MYFGITIIIELHGKSSDVLLLVRLAASLHGKSYYALMLVR